ncbi:MAG: cytochrome bc complex cytochrome b subunit [Planctomycetes bacterium]|nr:cytochrome bc complex cytochrome b subunit [Planctomycetota bacterium]
MLLPLRAWLARRLPPLDAARAAAARGLDAEPPPPGLGWSPVLGGALLLLFALQVFAGFLLLLYYQPSAAGAYASLERVVTRAPGGAVLRNLHVWGAHLLVLLLALHLLRAFWRAGHKRPFELVWLTGVALLGLALLFCFTGCVLPWNQLAYWATTIATEMIGALPGLGPPLLRLVRGGEFVGEPTLGRFFALHAFLLPALLCPLALLHFVQLRSLRRILEQNPTPGAEPAPSSASRPGAADAEARRVRLGALGIAQLAFGLLVTLAVLHPWELGEPADPLSTPAGVRPEWFFLPVYQGLKYVPAQVGPLAGRSLEIPLALAPGLALALLPWLDRGPARRPRERRRTLALAAAGVALAVGLGLLGALADRSVRIGGRALAFDLWGRPRLLPPPDSAGAR